MVEMAEDLRLEAIWHDIEGTRKSAGPLNAFLACAPGAIYDRTRGPGEAGVGGRLLAVCPDNTRKRYDTLLALETSLSAQADHSCLIGAACQVLEAELNRLLV